MEKQPNRAAGYEGSETRTAGDLQKVRKDHGKPPVSGKAGGATGFVVFSVSMYVVLLLLIKGLQAGKNSSIITSKKGGGRMSTAKKLIIDNLSNIPDDIQDEFEVMENLYKLLRFRKSQRSVAENGGYTTDEVRKMFQEKHEERTILA